MEESVYGVKSSSANGIIGVGEVLDKFTVSSLPMTASFPTRRAGYCKEARKPHVKVVLGTSRDLLIAGTESSATR